MIKFGNVAIVSDFVVILFSVQHGEEEDKDKIAESFTDENLTAMLDPVFNTADKNDDGFLDYFEYIEHSGVRLHSSH